MVRGFMRGAAPVNTIGSRQEEVTWASSLVGSSVHFLLLTATTSYFPPGLPATRNPHVLLPTCTTSYFLPGLPRRSATRSPSRGLGRLACAACQTLSTSRSSALWRTPWPRRKPASAKLPVASREQRYVPSVRTSLGRVAVAVAIASGSHRENERTCWSDAESLGTNVTRLCCVGN